MGCRYIVAFFLFLVYVQSGSGGESWLDTNATVRVFFTRSPGPEASVLVAVPWSGGESLVRAFTDEGREIPVKVVSQSASTLHAVVRTGEQLSDSGQRFELYCGPVIGEQLAVFVNQDTHPVKEELFYTRAKSQPAEWEQMRYLMGNAERLVYSKTKKTFDDVVSNPGRKDSGHRGGDGSLKMVRMSAHVVIPEDGVYRFAFNCNDSGFVMIDRSIAAQWTERHSAGRWERGEPLFMEKGPHLLEVFGVSAGVTGALIGIARGNGDKFERVENYELVTPVTPDALRIERNGKTLHAGFSFSLGKPYQFRGMDQVFVPVHLKDFSRNDLSFEYRMEWSLMSGRQSHPGQGQRVYRSSDRNSLEGSSVTHVFDSTGLHCARLMVRDSLGFVSTIEREIDSRNVQHREYAVSAVPAGFSPCQFENDIVEPAIRVAALGSDSLSFTLEWEWTDIDGRTHEGLSQLRPTAKASVVKLFSARVGDMEGVTWELSHEGYRIDGGVIRFCRFPYKLFPEKAIENRVYDAQGIQLVLVSSRAAGRFVQSRISRAHFNAGITCFDDTLSGVRSSSGKDAAIGSVLSGILGMGAKKIETRYISREETRSSAFEAGLIASFASGLQGGSGVAVVSLGLEHLLSAGRPHEFERILSGLTDMVLSRRTIRAVLVTMPPFGDDRDKAREYSAAIRRVASARGLPTADLYSGFMGMLSDVPLFEANGSELSDEGTRLAGQIIARSIASDYRTESGD